MLARAGFSLVEVIVALAVLAIAVMMFSGFFQSAQLTTTAQQETRISIAMRNYLDQVRGYWSLSSACSFENPHSGDCRYLRAEVPSLEPLINSLEGHSLELEVINRDSQTHADPQQRPRFADGRIMPIFKCSTLSGDAYSRALYGTTIVQMRFPATEAASPGNEPHDESELREVRLSVRDPEDKEFMMSTYIARPGLGMPRQRPSRCGSWGRD